MWRGGLGAPRVVARGEQARAARALLQGRPAGAHLQHALAGTAASSATSILSDTVRKQSFKQCIQIKTISVSTPSAACPTQC